MLKTWWEDIKHIPDIDTRWLLTWIIIYASFILLDLINPFFHGTNLIKYIGIFLCVVYAYNKYYSDGLLIAALFLTFIADTILVWTDWTVFGVYVFSFAQFMHLMRHYKANRRVVGAYAIGIAGLFLFSVLSGMEPIFAIATIYGLLLISNLVAATRRYRATPNNLRARCGFYGFIAFICCDFCVALRFIMLEGIVSARFLPLVAFMVWVFYYPSQVLIANSSLKQPSHKLAKKSTLG